MAQIVLLLLSAPLGVIAALAARSAWNSLTDDPGNVMFEATIAAGATAAAILLFAIGRSL